MVRRPEPGRGASLGSGSGSALHGPECGHAGWPPPGLGRVGLEAPVRLAAVGAEVSDLDGLPGDPCDGRRKAGFLRPALRPGRRGGCGGQPRSGRVCVVLLRGTLLADDQLLADAIPTQPEIVSRDDRITEGVRGVEGESLQQYGASVRRGHHPDRIICTQRAAL